MKLPRRKFLHLAASILALPAVFGVAKAQTYPTRAVRLTDEELRRGLAELEAYHEMTSAEFLGRYTAGELGDDLAYIRWSGLLRVGEPRSVESTSRVARTTLLWGGT